MSEWVWQGWFGPMPAAIAAKAITDADSRAGAWVPMSGDAPKLMTPDMWDVVGLPPQPAPYGAFGALTRPNAPMPTPPGMEEADPAIVGRLVGA